MNYINVDPATYYYAAAGINHAVGEFFTNYTFHLKALENTAAMAGSIGPGKHWGDHYNKHVQDTDQLVTALITLADRYIAALNQIGHLYALADHDPSSGTPPPAKPADPPLIFSPWAPPPPAVGGPGTSLIDDGLDLARKIVIPVPNGDTHKLHAAYTVWNALAEAFETTQLPTELGRVATLFATVTAPEVATIDDDLLAMKTAAEDLIAIFTELAGECAHQKTGHDKMRAQLGAILSVFADKLDEKVTVARTLEIDAAVITFGVGTTAVTAVRSGKATDLVDNTVGDLRTIVDAAELHDSLTLTRDITAARTGLERIHDAIETAGDKVEAASKEPGSAATTPEEKSKAVHDIVTDDSGALLGIEDAKGVQMLTQQEVETARQELHEKLGPPQVKNVPGKGIVETWEISDDPKSTVTYRNFSTSGGPTLDFNRVPGVPIKRWHVDGG